MGIEVGVVGGGIVGVSAAIVLREAGYATTLSTAGCVGDGASAAAHGQLVRPDVSMTSLWRDSVAFYDRFACARRVGNLVLVANAGDSTALAGRVDGHLISGSTMRARFPYLGPRVTAGLWQDEGRRIDPNQVVRHLASVAAARGAVLREHTKVRAIVPGRRRQWAMHHNDGSRSEFDVVVLAAGLGTRELGANSGVDVPIAGVRGRILRTQPMRPLFSTIVGQAAVGYPRPAHQPVALLAHQRADGVFLIGGSWIDEDQPDPADLDQAIVDNAIELIPALRGSRIEGSWSGIRPTTPDGRPIIDRLDDNLFVCCGHGGSGFITGPGTVLRLTESISARCRTDHENPFSYERFRTG
ncbi:NAD(P)/FAD-dependent oxidoreductase [Nocardia abscessus]|uniref:NAD(P)/FAD-dependent oxidoreductase n=1 Tax=Nocardia abscessus TaxID=120957 RepID=UPI0005BB7DFE|nr:FAD-dependent oxidoreductase [Nocardia abscessus]MCC3327945.1 FAD-binding oxidoreductase [Nocardia abscessus]